MKLSFLVCLLFIGVSSYAQQSDLLSQTSEVHHLLVNFDADHGSLERFYFVNNSVERRERMRTFYNDYLTRLNALPFDNMSVGGKVDFLLFRRDLESHLYLLAQEEKEVNQLPKLIAQGEPIYAAEKRRRRGEVMNWQDIAKQLNDCNKTITTAMGSSIRNRTTPNPLQHAPKASLKDNRRPSKVFSISITATIHSSHGG